MIKPTIGRKVWFRLNRVGLSLGKLVSHNPLEPMDATVVYVWSDRLVNLDVVDHDGNHMPVTSVQLVQKGDLQPECNYCEWMPYQVGQAEKTKEVISEADKAKHENLFRTAAIARASGPSSY